MTMVDFSNATSSGQPAETIELVLGREKELLVWLSPVVRRHSVTLDLSRVQRIDAAGIAALVSLYSVAQQTGHRFSVANLSPHVAEVLRLVGLDGILLFRRAGWKSNSGRCLEQSAA